ncbi:MAG: 1,4-alpha-glucan branching protein GlgB [Bacilli bacterium]
MDKNMINAFHTRFTSDAYEYFGSHYDSQTKSVVFRVYAPHAEKVGIVGDFNGWNSNANQMKKITSAGVWELVIGGVGMYENYKYSLTNKGRTFLKQDPYAYHNQTNGETSSKIYHLDDFIWSDEEWLEQRSQTATFNKPVNIYEVNLGSWIRYKDGNVYNYRRLADKLIPYVKKMGFTHIEIMPLTEFPFDGSWGYQVTGYFSVTSRYGTPADFMYFVNKAHQNNIGIILDWVPAHFPKDEFGLYEFDGEVLYEDPEPTRQEHRSWGTRIFNFQKPEVKSFLISSAKFFFDKYHIDGLRVDAVAAMIYLNYDREQWKPNIYGGDHNLEAICFLQDLNTSIFHHFPNVMMIAEESTDFANVSKPVYMGGLGFNYKWNMGWMNDTLKYMETDPLFRGYNHNRMTFSMFYAFSENFILPISHDEVVHGKKSLLNKMPGNYEEKFANARAYLGYMMTHPGKKLLFMGCEFGQFIEWDYKKELDWLLLAYPMHQKMQDYVAKLNKIYLKKSCLWEIEDSWDGFQWINADDKDNNCYIYQRMNHKGNELIVAINFSGRTLDYYRVGVRKGRYKEIINSDWQEFGGYDVKNDIVTSENIDANNKKHSIVIKIPKLSIVILERI